MNILTQFLKEKISKWESILNTHYETDAETPLKDYAQGTLRAFIEIKDFIDQQEKVDERKRVAEEEDRVGEQVGGDGESPLSKVQYE